MKECQPADTSLQQGRYCVGDDSVQLVVLRIRFRYNCFIPVFVLFIVLSDEYDLIVSDLIGPSSGAFCTSCIRRLWYVVIRVLLDTSSRS